MAKIKINTTKTEWIGLWYHPETHNYSSGLLNMSELSNYKGSVKVIARKNQWHKNGDNRPNMVFAIVGSECEEVKSIKLEEEQRERLYTEEEVYKVIFGMEAEYGLPRGENLISDFI